MCKADRVLSDGAPIEDLLKAANEASGHTRTIWVTFLLLGTYLAIAVGSTTHTDIFLENRITLPLLNVELDLVTFYWTAPLLFVIYHLYTLLAHYVLASKLYAFNSAISQASMPKVVQDEFRMRVHPYIVAQAIAGSERGLLPGMAMRLITWITLALAPVVLLLAFQIRFLPYHEPFWTWVHRSLLLTDLALVWALWPLVLHPSGRWSVLVKDVFAGVWRVPKRLIQGVKDSGTLLKRLWKRPGHWATLKSLWHLQADLNRETRGAFRAINSFIQLSFVSIAVAVFSIFVATVPGEITEKYVVHLAMHKSDSTFLPLLFTAEVNSRSILRITAALFDGPVDSVTLGPVTPFSRNLVVIDQDLVDGVERISFRGRDLRYAVLSLSNMANADFSESDMRNVNLTGVDLSGANLTGTNLKGANLDHSNLTAANFTDADLRDSNLGFANLKGANLMGTKLNSATLDAANLKDATNLTQDQLDGSCGSEITQLPRGLTIKSCSKE